MNRKISISIFIVLALALLAFFLFRVETAAAQTNDPLDVTFTPNPLFEEEGFLPADGADGTIVARNNTDSSHDVYIRFIEHSQLHSLADAINVSIYHSEGLEIRSQALNQWFDDGIVFLKNLGAEETAEFDLSAMFEAAAGNEYQNGSVNFDVCVGLSGGDLTCMSEEEDTIQSTTTTGQFLPDSDSEDDPEGEEEDGNDNDNEIIDLGDGGREGGAAPFALQGLQGGEQGLGDDLLASTEEEGETQGETQEEEEDEDTTQAAAALFGLPDSWAEGLVGASYFLLILLAIALLTIPFDALRGARYLPQYDRVVGRVAFMTSLSLIATVLALVIPILHSTFLPLFITTMVGVLWFGFEDRRLANRYY